VRLGVEVAGSEASFELPRSVLRSGSVGHR
jgi:hypothetical protein